MSSPSSIGEIEIDDFCSSLHSTCAPYVFWICSVTIALFPFLFYRHRVVLLPLAPGFGLRQVSGEGYEGRFLEPLRDR